MADVSGRSVAARPNEINNIHSHNAEKLTITNKDAERNSCVEGKHHKDRANHVTFVSGRNTSVIVLNEHIVLVDDCLKLFTSRLEFAQTVESVIKPSAFEVTSILVSQFSLSMLFVVHPLAFKFRSIFGHVHSVPMPNVLNPITSVVGLVSPFTSTDSDTHTLLVYLSLVFSLLLSR